MEFEQTELRLGLPGDHEKSNLNYGKRGYDEMVELKLNLSSTKDHDHEENAKNLHKEKSSVDSAKPSPPKAQVVGWPPVRSFRKNITMTAVPKSSGGNTEEAEKGSGGAAAFVKVSMDGAPYLRKVDLNMYKSYSELSHALTKLFSSFTPTCAAASGSGLMLKLMNEENNMMDQLDYNVPTYQDKDGDWMLVGDVPWEMFVESCKRLRIMKGTEAKGLAPRGMEKCKTRS